MLTLLECLQFCLIGAMIAIMLLALCYSIAMPAIDRWSKRFFYNFLFCINNMFVHILYRYNYLLSTRFSVGGI
jgi:hypothetical protein